MKLTHLFFPLCKLLLLSLEGVCGSDLRKPLIPKTKEHKDSSSNSHIQFVTKHGVISQSHAPYIPPTEDAVEYYHFNYEKLPLCPINGKVDSILFRIKNGDMTAVDALLAYRNTVSQWKDPTDAALYVAVDYNHVDIAAELLKNGARNIVSTKVGGWNAYSRAVMRGNPDMVRLFLNQKDLFKYGRHADSDLHIAVLYGHVEIVSLLLDHKPEYCADQGAEHGAEHGTERGTEHDADQGAEHDAEDCEETPSYTPSNVNAIGEDRCTPLMYAARDGRLDIATVLHKHGALIDEVSAAGSTALFYAAKNGHYDVAEYLLKHNADPKIVSHSGRTALHDACNRSGNELVIKLLVQHGASLTVQDSKGEDPLCALMKHYSGDFISELVELLPLEII